MPIWSTPCIANSWVCHRQAKRPDLSPAISWLLQPLVWDLQTPVWPTLRIAILWVRHHRAKPFGRSAPLKPRITDFPIAIACRAIAIILDAPQLHHNHSFAIALNHHRECALAIAFWQPRVVAFAIANPSNVIRITHCSFLKAP